MLLCSALILLLPLYRYRFNDRQPPDAVLNVALQRRFSIVFVRGSGSTLLQALLNALPDTLTLDEPEIDEIAALERGALPHKHARLGHKSKAGQFADAQFERLKERHVSHAGGAPASSRRVASRYICVSQENVGIGALR